MRQVRGGRADVRHFQHQALRQLLLHAETPLLDARRLQVRIQRELAGLGDGLRRIHKCLVDHCIFALLNQLGGARHAAGEIQPCLRVHRRIERVARSRKLRPLSGRSTMVRWSTTWPTVPDSVSSSDCRAATSTDCVVCPTSSVTSTRAFWSTCNTNAGTIAALKFVCLTVTE